MKLNAAMLMAALVLSGTVLAQSSGPSAGGQAKSGQGGNVTTGQALTGKETDDSAPPAEQVKPGTAVTSNTVGVSRGRKTDRRLEHYP
jgi:hypothetical protein